MNILYIWIPWIRLNILWTYIWIPYDFHTSLRIAKWIAIFCPWVRDVWGPNGANKKGQNNCSGHGECYRGECFCHFDSEVRWEWTFPQRAQNSPPPKKSVPKCAKSPDWIVGNDQIQFIYFSVQVDFMVKRICFWNNTGAKSRRGIFISLLFVQIPLESKLIGFLVLRININMQIFKILNILFPILKVFQAQTSLALSTFHVVWFGWYVFFLCFSA